MRFVHDAMMGMMSDMMAHGIWLGFSAGGRWARRGWPVGGSAFSSYTHKRIYPSKQSRQLGNTINSTALNCIVCSC